jgi:hypothetical protein
VTVPVPIDPLKPEFVTVFHAPSYVAVIVVGLPAPARLEVQVAVAVEPDAISVLPPGQRVAGDPLEVVVNVTVPVGAVVPEVGLTVAEYVTDCPKLAIEGFAVTVTTDVVVPCSMVSLVD